MKQISLKKGRLMFAIAVSLLLASCIDGYKDDWTFSSGVTNTTLLSPDSSKVVFSKDVKGNLVVTWPVVYGAGGYQFSLYIDDDPNNPVAVGTENEVIDGCSATRALQEDTKYKVVIKALGNAKYNNKDAEKAATAKYSTLLPAYAVIPDGTDLYQYFSSTTIPDSIGELAYELVANGKYTLSGPVDFQKHWITLRGDKVFHPTITYGVSGRLRTTAGFTLKYMDIDCNAMPADATDAALLLLSANPDPAILSTAYNNYYIIRKDVFFYKCNFYGINRRLIYDANVKYCLANLIISDCKIALNALNDASGGIIYLQGGFANTFTIKNSTVWGNTKTEGYFLRYNNSGRPDRAGFVSGSINFFNNTFYNVVYSKQIANYDGMRSSSVKLNVIQNIFCDCGSGEVIRRLSGSQTTMVRTIRDNCYWYNNAFPEAQEVTATYGDKSGTAYGEDPAFTDPANGNFTIGSSATTIISKQSGDPRWLPVTK
jgi:hypothetical protein